MPPELPEWRESRDLPQILCRVRPFTMVPRDSLVDLARQVRVVLEQGIPGEFVECGAWRGGSSFLMAEVLKQAGISDRRVWLFDSFEGIQPPEAVDGPAAQTWAQNKEGPMYFDNLRAPVEGVRRSAEELGVAPLTRMVPGWFDKTLPATRGDIGKIALLRIDADWHASVKCCLDNLYDQVTDGGFVVFDDYYTWDGCAVAVHEFLGARGLNHRIESVGESDLTCAVFRKGPGTWRWQRQLHLLNQDLVEHVPANARVVLVDQEMCRTSLPARHTMIPFIEREGVYWGPPADDATAIEELHRLRHAGAHWMAYAWPAFWWFEHYSEFTRHLNETFRRVLSNDRCVLFDLRQPGRR